ncbi:MAG: hypothetical protein OXI15_15595 [Chromatiales bacterium]|nr:hypothetical protein [Chromatiales bacterium]
MATFAGSASLIAAKSNCVRIPVARPKERSRERYQAEGNGRGIIRRSRAEPYRWLPFRESLTLVPVIGLLPARPQGLQGRREAVRRP